MEDFLQLEAAAKQLGLEMNRDKCEIFGHSDNTRSLFASHGINLPETNLAEVNLLGAPLSAGQHLDAVLEVNARSCNGYQNDLSSCHHMTVYTCCETC